MSHNDTAIYRARTVELFNELKKDKNSVSGELVEQSFSLTDLETKGVSLYNFLGLEGKEEFDRLMQAAYLHDAQKMIDFSAEKDNDLAALSIAARLVENAANLETPTSKNKLALHFLSANLDMTAEEVRTVKHFGSYDPLQKETKDMVFWRLNRLKEQTHAQELAYS